MTWRAPAGLIDMKPKLWLKYDDVIGKRYTGLLYLCVKRLSRTTYDFETMHGERININNSANSNMEIGKCYVIMCERKRSGNSTLFYLELKEIIMEIE